MIEQCRFSESVKFFKDKFMHRWGLADYVNKSNPCIFVGVYDQCDVDAINTHEGFKVLMITSQLPACFKNVNPGNLWIIEGNGMPCDVDRLKYRVKRVNIQMKDYSLFVPTPLGNSIYCYMGNWERKELYKYSQAERLKDLIEREIILAFIDKSKPETLTDDYLVRMYSKCFVNLQLSSHGGRVGIVEMGYMGRKTILTASIEKIRENIERESKKIGTVQPSTIRANYFEDGWMQLNFWNEV